MALTSVKRLTQVTNWIAHFLLPPAAGTASAAAVAAAAVAAAAARNEPPPPTGRHDPLHKTSRVTNRLRAPSESRFIFTAKCTA